MCAHTVPPPHSESLAQRVFFIPELVDVIFNFLDRKANVTNALVCKQWSPIALDVVWKEVDDLVQLFSLLKPIREATRSEEEYEYVFEAMPDANDWLRFEPYASRVRCLRFHSDMELQEDEFVMLLRNLPELRKIALPKFHFTSSLIEELSRAKSICAVEVNHDDYEGDGDPKNVETFAPVLAEGAFPSLSNLGLVAKIDHLDRFFRSNFAPINITTLHIDIYRDYCPSKVHDFLENGDKQQNGTSDIRTGNSNENA
ncbi:hypothetical protein PAXINDRAFT_8120 [Paxillus involutus ATCC 200175]|nr:hypothetical protein PAXINDRAFT_8120 [Paxillus involutus ATCC 200175]